MSICYLAIDVGGAKLAAAIVSEQGEVLVRDRIATPQREVWAALSRLVLRVMAAAPTPPVGCGVGCGGPMNPAERTVTPLHIPTWKAFPLASEVEKYDLAHLRRLDVLPGITGLWQVEARQDPSFDSYISLDTAYVENWNLMLDLRILARTVGVVLGGTGS